MSSDWIYYFGYGSLVNRDTRPADEIASPARLKGWRRVWDHRVSHTDRDVRCTSMSIEPLESEVVELPAAVEAAAVYDDGSASGNANTITSSNSISGIDGVVVRLERQLLPVLDARERGYERLALPAEEFDLPLELEVDTVMIYRSLPENRNLADTEHPVLQSYRDCIMAGYQRVFGDSGLQALINSTRGWDKPVYNDRVAPRYPRSVSVDEQTLNHFDSSILRHLQGQ